MSSLLKDRYSPDFYAELAGILSDILPNFDSRAFTDAIFVSDFEQYELKERMVHTTGVLHSFLPDDFEEAVSIILEIIKELNKRKIRKELEYLFLADYISTYGLDTPDVSIAAMEQITQYSTCEFAVRPFILKYEDRMMDQMLQWSTHNNLHVRRFASEGARPRLPWGMALPFLKKNPAPLLPILENLKQDSSEYVRRSVANNLNDISKDHPDITLETARSWQGISQETDALIKHGCRTLLKQGHPEALQIFGYDSTHLEIKNQVVTTPEIAIGDYLEFQFLVHNSNNKPKLLRLEYAIYFLKKNGEYAKKVFKISEREISAGESQTVHKKHSFRPITTRTYYPGLHKVSIIINGKESDTMEYQLVSN